MTEENDTLLKIFYKLLWNVYNNNSGMEKMPGEEATMCKKELKIIADKSGLLNENCGYE